MSSASSNLVSKVWNYCNLLRDDGVSYGDYVEQLTYLLFLKMDYERTRPPYNHKSTIPDDYNWASLMEVDGIPLERHYRNTLENLGKEPGILGIIFRKAQNKIQNPAHLRRLIVDLIDKEPWSALSADVKGDIYEGLLEKNAQDTKSGAGQYFTPRVLIDAIVEVTRAQPGTTIIDPAAGTARRCAMNLLPPRSRQREEHRRRHGLPSRQVLRQLRPGCLPIVETPRCAAKDLPLSCATIGGSGEVLRSKLRMPGHTGRRRRSGTVAGGQRTGIQRRTFGRGPGGAQYLHGDLVGG